MNEFFDKLKQDAEKLGEDAKNVWEGAKDAFERDAANENAELGAYHDLFAWADGSLAAMPYTEQEISDKDQEMKTLAVMLVKDQSICAPADAAVKSIDPAKNTIVLRMSGSQAVAIKVCLSAVSFEKDAQILVKPGESVKRGQALVHFNHPIEAKSKLLLVEPETFADFTGAGFVPLKKSRKVTPEEIIITQANPQNRAEK